MVFGIGFLLLVSMVISAALSALTAALGNVLPMPGYVAQLMNFLVSFIVVTLLFAMMFKVLPDATVRWGDVWTGALFTSLLFNIGKYALGVYLGRAATASSYGLAGSLVVVLLWIYYSSLILLFGAEFTQVHARKRGSRIVPTKNAVSVSEMARAQQGMPRKEWAAPSSAGTHSRPEPEWDSRSMSPRPRTAGQFGPSPLPAPTGEERWKAVPKPAEIVSGKPYPYLGIALGLGVLTGWVAKRDWPHLRRQRH